MLKIDPADPTPIFRQIADGLCGDILTGVYRPGDLVPSVRQLSLRILVNANTIQRAYELLERGGLIESQKGIGMRVTDVAPALAARLVGADVEQGLARVIEVGRAAGLSRTDIDALYATAWDNLPRPPSNKPRKP